MTLDTPSLMLTNTLLTATLAVCLALVARRDRADGLFYWGLALTAHCAAYVLYMLRGQVSDWFSVVLANMLLVSAFALMQEGLYQFQGRKAPRWRLWLPVLALGVLFALLLGNIHARVVVLACALCLQFAQFAVAMGQRWAETPGRGKFFVMAGIALSALALVVRAVAVLMGQLAMGSITDSGLLQTLVFAMAAVAMILVNFGIVVMIKERADARNHTLAFMDELTGLHNRRHVLLALEQQIAWACRARQPLSLLLLDVDFFKRINDTLGHLSGDQVLRDLGAGLRSHLRACDIAGRWGGEEFIVVLPGTDAAGAATLAERLRGAVEAKRFVMPDGTALMVTVSIGLHTLHPVPVDATADTLLGLADRALYRAKALGRNRVEVA